MEREDYLFQLSHQHILDEIYRELYGVVSIDRLVTSWIEESRATPDELVKLEIDKSYHIDTFIKTQNKRRSYQEKLLRYKYSNYNTVTIEYYSDHPRQIQGEYFQCCAQYYLSAYCNDDNTSYKKYCIINMPNFYLWAYKQKNIERHMKLVNNNRGQASFLAIPLKELPKSVLITYKGNYGL